MRFWPILTMVIVLNVAVGLLMYLGRGAPATSPKPIYAGSALGAGGLPMAYDAPYNYRQMALGGAVMTTSGVLLVWFLRRHGRAA